MFLDLVQSVKESPDDIKPEQIADVLALGVVLLHPFHDGNGRTARAIGLLFRDNYDSDEYQSDFDTIAEPRDEVRKRGDRVIFGYTPHFPDGFNQSDPEQVIGYLTDLLKYESPNAFESPFKYS